MLVEFSRQPIFKCIEIIARSIQKHLCLELILLFQYPRVIILILDLQSFTTSSDFISTSFHLDSLFVFKFTLSCYEFNFLNKLLSFFQ